MNTFLQHASQALAANDAECLEEMCASIPDELPADQEERAALILSLQVFDRQVRSARQNVILRERLLQQRLGEDLPWAR